MRTAGTLVLLVGLVAGRRVEACPSCACANPAMTSMGAEQPFVNRVRLAATMRGWQQDEGIDGVDATRLRELRLDLSSSWSPTRWFTLVVNVPVQLREHLSANLERQTAFGWGEVDLLGRFVVLGADELRPKALVSVVGGARFPTALTLSDAEHRRLDTDAQLGAGALSPQLGVAWTGFFSERWSALATLTGELPLTGRYGFRGGPSAVLFAVGQLQPARWLSVRAGAEVRGELPETRNGVADARLAGVVMNAVVDVGFQLGTHALLFIGARVPTLDTRPGPVHTWPIPLATVVVDL